MSELDAADSQPARPTVFLSYASGDREAARLLRDALPAYGLETWYDESELGGGEAWDHKIRRQIRECDYFMPVVSAQTEARLEGYFRREWRFAVERTLDMADDHPFLLPIVIDDTDQSAARVPEKFLTVQWVKVPGGEPNRALEALCRRVASGNLKQAPAARSTPRRPDAVAAVAAATAPPLELPEFPREEPGQRVRFWFEIAGWALRSLRMLFRKFPRWVRLMAYVWAIIAFFSLLHSSKDEGERDVSRKDAAKVKAISDKYQGSLNKGDIAKLGAQIAKQFADDDDPDAVPGKNSPLLAIPFTAPSGDAAAGKLADATFAMAYGMVSIAHRGQAAVTNEPLASRDLGAALERGRANHSAYVLFGTVDGMGAAQALTVKIAKVADGSVVWSNSYPAAAADPAKIAVDVNEKMPALKAN